MPWEEPARSPGGYTFLRSFALTLQAYCFCYLLGLPVLAWKKESTHTHPFFSPAEVQLVGYTLPPFPPRSFCFLRWTRPPCCKKKLLSARFPNFSCPFFGAFPAFPPTVLRVS